MNMNINWKKIKEEYLKLVERLDDNINFLSLLPINENRHTNILAAILSYKQSNRYPFIKSLLKRIFPDLVAEEKWNIATQDNYIDTLLQSDSYAIIIENKACGAGDQPGQIQTYIQNMQDRDFDFENIYVIYLTPFGGSPNSSSLPENLKESLGEHYAEVTYINDILPWLEEDVLPQCPYREQSLICSLKLYADYIREMLGIDVRQQKIATKVLKLLSKEGMKDYTDIKKSLAEISKDQNNPLLQQILNIVLRQMEKEDIYVNDELVAYNLKWLLRNNPTPDYRIIWKKRDYTPFNSIGYFTYFGVRYIQMAAHLHEKNIRLHLRCDKSGLKLGAYILDVPPAELSDFWDKDSLINAGFLINDNGIITLPFNDFDEKMSLVDVTEYLWKMIQTLNNAAVYGKR